MVPPEYSGHLGLVKTQVQWDLKDLLPNTNYQLAIDGEQVSPQQADSEGNLIFTTVLDDEEALRQFRISQISE